MKLYPYLRFNSLYMTMLVEIPSRRRKIFNTEVAIKMQILI